MWWSTDSLLCCSNCQELHHDANADNDAITLIPLPQQTVTYVPHQNCVSGCQFKSLISADMDNNAVMLPLMMSWCLGCGASNNVGSMQIVYISYTLKSDNLLLIDNIISGYANSYAVMPLPLMMMWHWCHFASNDGNIMLMNPIGHASKSGQPLLFQPKLLTATWCWWWQCWHDAVLPAMTATSCWSLTLVTHQITISSYQLIASFISADVRNFAVMQTLVMVQCHWHHGGSNDRPIIYIG